MGTVAEKLSYLAYTKDLFKDRLNSLGAEIIGSTTFRNYLNWLDTFYGEVSDKTDLAKNGVVGRTSQESTTGKNLLPNNANSQTINGVTFTVNEDKSITVNGTATANSFFEFFNGNILLGNTITAIRKTTKSSPTQYPRLLLSIGGTEYNADNVESHRNYRVFTGGGALTKAGIGIQNGETYNETLYCMIVDGETTDNETYEPYTGGQPSPNPDYPQPINNLSGDVEYKVRGKNLFDKDNANILNAYFNSNIPTITSNDSNRVIYIKCEANTTYTLSRLKGSVFSVGYTTTIPTNGTSVSGAINGTMGTYDGTTRVNCTITTGNNAQYLVCRIAQVVNDGDNSNNIINNLQIEENPTPTEYEPYISESFPLSLGDIELCDISDYKDRIYSQNGEFYLEKKTDKVVLDGSENWTINTSYTYNVFYRTLDNYARISNTQTTYCEYYKGIENVGGIANFGNNYNNSIGVRTANDNIKDIYISNNSITSASDFKTWLSTHNTVVYYALATPTTTEITQENYPALYSQLLAIQEFLTKYKINNEFLLDYSSPEIEY